MRCVRKWMRRKNEEEGGRDGGREEVLREK